MTSSFQSGGMVGSPGLIEAQRSQTAAQVRSANLSRQLLVNQVQWENRSRLMEIEFRRIIEAINRYNSFWGGY